MNNHDPAYPLNDPRFWLTTVGATMLGGAGNGIRGAVTLLGLTLMIWAVARRRKRGRDE